MPYQPTPYYAPEMPHTAVEVNFEIVIEGDSNLSIFGQKKEAVLNPIVAEVGLPVNALYDGANDTGLIEFWEPKADPDSIYVSLADKESKYMDAEGVEQTLDLSGKYKEAAKRMVRGIQRVLCGAFDCTGAVPFNVSKYAGIEEYTKHRDFGRVALGAFAHYLFGHVDATSAITNDVAFIRDMLSLSSSTADAAAVMTAVTTEHNWVDGSLFKEQAATEGSRLRNTQYSKTTPLLSTEVAAMTNASGSASDANLAVRLVQAILKKGLVGNALTGNPIEYSKVNDASLTAVEKKAALAYIVAQVLGQDATRAMNADNSERTVEQHQLLRFYEGDVIYMSIKLKTPNVTVGEGNAVGEATFENSYDEQTYVLKITLEEEDLSLNSS
jgi:hypothetical protein